MEGQRRHVCETWRTQQYLHSVNNVFLFFQEVQSKSKVCANVFCGAGRECAVNEKGEPSCLCIEVRVGSAESDGQLFHAKKKKKNVAISWNYKKGNEIQTPEKNFCLLFWVFISLLFSRPVSPTRGQSVAAMGRPTGITVSSTGMLVWLAWRSRWPTMDTARVRDVKVSAQH